MKNLNFSLRDNAADAHIALCDLLKATGLSESGGAAKAQIAQGLVQVNGQQELRKTCKIRAGQVVQTGQVRIKVLAAEAELAPLLPQK